ncbi:hypothetical protein P7K49_010186, partial [Saguinus oedipus]
MRACVWVMVSLPQFVTQPCIPHCSLSCGPASPPAFHQSSQFSGASDQPTCAGSAYWRMLACSRNSL